MIHHEIRRTGKDYFLDIYASSNILGWINVLARKCGVYGGDFILDRKGQTIGRSYFSLQDTRYGGFIHTAPLGFLKVVQRKFNGRVASFKSQFPSLTYQTLLSKYAKVEFKVVSKGDEEYLNIYARPEVISYVDSRARSEGVSLGEEIKDVNGSVVGRSYYKSTKNKCVKWERPSKSRNKWAPKKCLEYGFRAYAPNDFAFEMKSVLVPKNIMNLREVKSKLREFKEVEKRESERANTLLLCVEDLDTLVRRAESINPQSLKPKEYGISWTSINRLLGASARLKEDLLAQQKYPLPSRALEGKVVYEKIKSIPWLRDKLKFLKRKNFFPTLAFQLGEIEKSLTKKRNYLTSMIYLNEADNALFATARDTNLTKKEKAKKIEDIKKKLDYNLRHYLKGDPKNSFGLTLSRVFLQKYDVVSEKYFQNR